MNRVAVWYLLVCFGAGMLAQACSQETKTPLDRGVPVVAAPAILKTVPVEMKAMGTVEAYQSVSVRSQITAQIRKAFFREGQDVRKGDPLIELDCRAIEASFRQAEANLARDRAQAKYAREQVSRYADLVKKDYVARDQYDQILANADAADATVRSDEAAVESARVQLQYCSIHSPIDGRTGMLMVDLGNLVKADDTELLTINQVQPVYVSFTIPEGDLPTVMKYFTEKKVEADAFIPSEDNPEKGELVFVDNAIDRATGTITLKALFANRDRRLVPGQFVDVVLTLATRPDAVLVPTKAVEQGQEGQYVFVVKADSTVEMRPVRTGSAFRDETLILEGLRPGEQVVTDGQMRLTPGSKVSVKKAQ
ncbi:MAG TPA: efflux RND transporter periplasmic adaptor subunit [Deltaproteobacteria bacterium]|nr:efflux RND transporter periplasmic adaptor subunit [Deltaproteobacteria bacterium]HPR55823.1 efflux RND transporter periplasmic adaptor subunit [Deltaproteobacteria bacterium]HXK47708.1 efflux RND transporter periplasmic adaptor subunit [Deltaproteobacteria bacterium]